MGRLTNTKKGNIMVTMQIILKTSVEVAGVRNLICQLNNGASFKAMHLKATTTSNGGRDRMVKYPVSTLGF